MMLKLDYLLGMAGALSFLLMFSNEPAAVVEVRHIVFMLSGAIVGFVLGAGVLHWIKDR